MIECVCERGRRETGRREGDREEGGRQGRRDFTYKIWERCRHGQSASVARLRACVCEIRWDAETDCTLYGMQACIML